MHNLCLHNRTQLVRVGSVSSNPTTLATDVPQGCVLGPVLFSAYILHIGSLIGTHNLQHPQYTNDTQMFISVSPSDSTHSVSRLQSCLTDLYCWLSHNALFLSTPRSLTLSYFVLGKDNAHFTPIATEYSSPELWSRSNF